MEELSYEATYLNTPVMAYEPNRRNTPRTYRVRKKKSNSLKRSEVVVSSHTIVKEICDDSLSIESCSELFSLHFFDVQSTARI